MSCIRGNVKKGLGQSGLFFLTRSCIINEQECLTIYYVTHSGERKEELRRRLTETRRKIFKINKELTASVVIIEIFEEKMMASSCVFPIIEAKGDLFPSTDLNN